jgi:AAT family amino acid transporter
LGGIIGSCYFLGLGLTFHDMGAGAVLLSYGLAGITIYGVMQSFAELLVNIPRRGSFVSYTREFMGDTASAGIGWAFWANWVCYIPSEAIAVATFVNALFLDGRDDSAYHWKTFLWGVIALAILTAINLYHVKWFGHIESIMAIVKIAAIVLFVLAALAIWMGIANHGATFSSGEEGETATVASGFIGFKAMLSQTGLSAIGQLFPGGGLIIITMMIWTLVNFQGSEIVGLSAAETKNPEKNVPAACKKVAFRIILIYLIPIFVLSLIMPYFTATLDDSVFAQALVGYGFGWGAKIFEIVTLIAAFSCANSGFYGTVRSLYGLSVEGLAPKRLSMLNRFSTPHNATVFTLVFVWIVFVFSFVVAELGFFGGEDNHLYIALIGIAGFTGTLCWVGILYSQIVFRKRLKERGYDPHGEGVLKVKAAWFPWLEWFAIIVQVAAMVLLIFEVGDGIPIFLLSMDIIVVPIAVFAIQKYRGKIRTTITIGADESTFDESYPVKAGSLADTHPKTHAVADGGGTPHVVALLVTTAISLVLSIVAINWTPAELAEDTTIFNDPAMGRVWLALLVEVVCYAVVVYSSLALSHRRIGPAQVPAEPSAAPPPRSELLADAREALREAGPAEGPTEPAEPAAPVEADPVGLDG